MSGQIRATVEDSSFSVYLRKGNAARLKTTCGAALMLSQEEMWQNPGAYQTLRSSAVFLSSGTVDSDTPKSGGKRPRRGLGID